MNIKELWEKCIGNRIVVIGLLVAVFPVGLYCMWKGEHFTTPVRWGVTVFMLWWAWNIVTDNPSQNIGTGDCSAVIQSGGCTYYRDSSCNVISMDCD